MVQCSSAESVQIKTLIVYLLTVNLPTAQYVLWSVTTFYLNFLLFFSFLVPDIDECRYGYCQQLCANVPGSYSCSCNPGFILNPDSRTCQGKHIHKHRATALQQEKKHLYIVYQCCQLPASVFPDVDECADEPCSHGCLNTYGSYMCNCDEGFELASDGTTCIGEEDFILLIYQY